MANVIGLFSARSSSLLRCPISRILAQRVNMQIINLIHTNPFNQRTTTPLIQVAIKLQQPTAAFMSYDTSNKIHNQIDKLIKESKKRVFVFMKGDPEKPLCGYSGMVVQLLNFYQVDYDTCDVLDNEDIRREIKSYSDWPTIPQVYVDGTFLGGCDILLQMHQSGELKPMFTNEASPTEK